MAGGFPVDVLLTPDEVASRLRLSRRTIVGWLQEGRLTGIKVGNRWRVRAETVDEMMRDTQTNQDKTWLEQDIGGALPPFDWGPEGEPVLQTIEFRTGTGLVILGE